MKTWKSWAFFCVVALAILSTLPGAESGGGSIAQQSVSATAAPQATPEAQPEPETPIRQHWKALQPLLVDYDTQRVNSTLIAAQTQATREGKQPLEVVRQWQRGIANDYLYEVNYGSGAESQNLKQSLISRYAYTVIAESVLLNNQPMQAVSIDERAIACELMRGYLGGDFGGECDAAG